MIPLRGFTVVVAYRCRWVPVVKCPQCKQDMPADHPRHLAGVNR